MALTIKQWRLAKEITQQTMADALDVSVPTYRGMEDNPDKMPIGMAKVAAKTLGVTIDDISFFTTERVEM